MEDVEQMLRQVLNDPEQMQKIAQLAGSFLPTEPAEQAPPSVSEPFPALLTQGESGREENLLNALKPFLRPEKREKIDRALQAVRISHLAGAAMQSHGAWKKET